MKITKLISMILLTTLLITACAVPLAGRKSFGKLPTTTSCATPEADNVASCQINPSTSSTVVATEPVSSQPDLTQTDTQGAITVEITPENLDQPGDTLIFDVILDTHSIDLSMDLAQLATLTTDSGTTIQALNWDAPRGGHHVTGKLSFSTSLNGTKVIEGAKSFSIIISNLDVPTRQFLWSLN